MFLLGKYPDLMTKEQVAEALNFKPITIPRLKGLKKTFLGNGKRNFSYRKQDVIDYIDSKVEREEVINNASEQKKRHGKVGIPPFISWNELQKAPVGNP